MGNLTSYADDADGSSGFYSKFGAKIGTGAAKLGKKAAQSEAGRSAGKAAIKGATDGARQDLTDRYLKRGEYGDPGSTPTSPTGGKPKEQPASPQTKESSHRSDNIYHDDDDDDDDHIHSSSPRYTEHHTPTFREPRPPKPSIFSRLKGSAKPAPSAHKRAVPIRRNPKDRVYRHHLTKEADWDRMPMAQTLYNFKGEMKCDLIFRKGQVIKIITRTDNQFDWWEGKLEDRVGIFPANYVKIL